MKNWVILILALTTWCVIGAQKIQGEERPNLYDGVISDIYGMTHYSYYLENDSMLAMVKWKSYTKYSIDTICYYSAKRKYGDLYEISSFDIPDPTFNCMQISYDRRGAKSVTDSITIAISFPNNNFPIWVSIGYSFMLNRREYLYLNPIKVIDSQITRVRIPSNAKYVNLNFKPCNIIASNKFGQYFGRVSAPRKDKNEFQTKGTNVEFKFPAIKKELFTWPIFFRELTLISDNELLMNNTIKAKISSQPEADWQKIREYQRSNPIPQGLKTSGGSFVNPICGLRFDSGDEVEEQSNEDIL
ncbi:MAG: hypothetical protein HDS07_08335 [Bacteroides sp.]|nr:hypothetical protein [Bacteroides sp.]